MSRMSEHEIKLPVEQINLPGTLHTVLRKVSKTGTLTVIYDYDSTISTEPLEHKETFGQIIWLLHRLAEEPSTNVHIISNTTLEKIANINVLTHGLHLHNATVTKIKKEIKKQNNTADNTAKKNLVKKLIDKQPNGAYVLFSDVLKTTRKEMTLTVNVKNEQTHHHLYTEKDVVASLYTLKEYRKTWQTGHQHTPIQDHTLLANGNQLALMNTTGNITWLCWPQPDSGSIFAELVSDKQGGHFSIHPEHTKLPLEHKYKPNSMTVQTNWSGVNLEDKLETTTDETLILTRTIHGTKPVKISFAPRPDYGREIIKMETVPHGLQIFSETCTITLHALGLNWKIHTNGVQPTAVATYLPTVTPYTLTMTITYPNKKAGRIQKQDKWEKYSKSLTLPDIYKEETLRSALTLKSLCNEKHGSALAAATTSLPEWKGGVRNWDYRYCWLRDGAMTVTALAQLNSWEETTNFVNWLHKLLPAENLSLAPLYTLAGTGLPEERSLDDLAGYAASRPVRYGNAADGQTQTDVYYPIVDMLWNKHVHGKPLTDKDKDILNHCVQKVANNWNKPDHGIWEIRDTPRHHTHSRVSSWASIHFGSVMLKHLGQNVTYLETLSEEIRNDVLTYGYNENVGSFVSAYGRTDVDAAVLVAITSGLIPGTDYRALNTIDKVEELLRDGPGVYRYRHDDGLPGTEGGMHICGTWLIQAYTMSGQEEKAHTLLKQILKTSGTTGLLPEMVDPHTGEGLGNHPQAYSHLGIIQSVLKLNCL